MAIRVLSPEVVAKIAAGEVIERPVSVAKELLENAIDAGADDIHLEIAQGGRRLIQVSDNGCGIPSAEVELAFARHATSKLSSADELYGVRTLGFRGEALASIAAVSKLTMTTRVADEQTGSLLRLEGGQVLNHEAQSRAPGTTVRVENLFFNTPARLKFLRSDATEAGHVARLATSYALAFPAKRVTLENNGRLVLRSPGTGALYDTLIALLGLDVAEQMLTVTPEQSIEDIHVSGYISAASLHRANRQDMTFFVNQRWIQDNAISYAVNEAYRTLLPAGRYPVVVLHVEMSPDQVDVNVHPTKREVRFRRDRDVFLAVQRAARTTLMASEAIPVVSATAPSARPWRERELPLAWQGPARDRLDPLEIQRTGELPTPEATAVSPSSVWQRLPMLRVVGQIAQTYIIAEGPGGMYLIDQHAAHERIRYEDLQRQQSQAQVTSQELLDPLPLDLSPRQAMLLEEHLETLATFGLELAPFGGATFLIRRVPVSLVGQDVAAAIVELVDAALAASERFSWDEQALITLSCHGAVRAGQTLSVDEMRDLIRQLEQTDLPHTCPHGRPTMIHLSQAQLEKEFGRG
jgi:DNA mismatch repair protein MutL